MSLKYLRQKIDKLDKKMIAILNERADVSHKIGAIKKKTGSQIYAPDREKLVLKKLAKLSKGPLSKKAIEAIYSEIMSAALSLEKDIVVAYLGPQATFTHLAALRKFGSSVKYLACDSISDVALEVERGKADYGVVPVENSVEGAVTHTLDMLIESNLKICAEVISDISHNLLGSCPIKRIKTIYSNPQVIGQCRMWLRRNLPGVDLVDVVSTTKAAQLCNKNKRNTACIASLLAAQIYKLKVMAKGIEDSPHNKTRFLVISKDDTPQTGEDKTSITFSIKDRVGALHDMLVPFKRYGINLLKIESRPSKRRAWDYYFFVDLAGHCQELKVKKALRGLENACKHIKILGSYPISG